MADMLIDILLITLLLFLMFYKPRQRNVKMTTLNAIKFAKLISYITQLAGTSLNYSQVEFVRDGIVDTLDIQPNSTMSITQVRNEVDNLFRAYNTNSKIEAIKAYRTLTGYGLKESKDAVEALIKDCHNNYNSDGYSK